MDSDIRKILDRYPSGKPDSLIPLLQAIQAESGHLSGEILEKVSQHLSIPANKVYGVATFYDQFRFRPRGKYHFKVCHGTSCHLGGSESVIRELEKQLNVKSGRTTHDGLFSLEEVTCFGSCEQGPVLLVNEKPYSKISLEQIGKLIESFKEKESSDGL